MSMWSTAGTKDPPTQPPVWRIVPSPDIAGALSYDLPSLALGNGSLERTGAAGMGELPGRTHFLSHLRSRHDQRLARARARHRPPVLSGGRYSARPLRRTAGSPTRGRVAEYRIGVQSPRLVIVPPGVWHGFQNDGNRSGHAAEHVGRRLRSRRPGPLEVADRLSGGSVPVQTTRLTGDSALASPLPAHTELVDVGRIVLARARWNRAIRCGTRRAPTSRASACR